MHGSVTRPTAYDRGMVLGRDYPDQDCSLARALEVVGERWTMLVLRDCFYGVRRFSDLQARLDIPRAVLAARLAALVDTGLLERHEYRPGREEYVLTERAVGLWPALFALAKWGDEHFSPAGPSRLFAHAACGTDVTAAGWCPTCGLVPAPADLVVRPGPGLRSRRPDRASVVLREPHRMLTPVVS